MSKVKEIVKRILNTIIKPTIICPCGYATTSEAEAKQHVNVHPLSLGSLDEAGNIIW